MLKKSHAVEKITFANLCTSDCQEIMPIVFFMHSHNLKPSRSVTELLVSRNWKSVLIASERDIELKHAAVICIDNIMLDIILSYTLRK